MSRHAQRRFALEPLLELVGPLEVEHARGGTPGHNVHGRLGWDDSITSQDAPSRVLSKRFGVTRRTVIRWRKQGLPEDAADKAACELGLHPASIWPEWYEDVSEY